MTENQCVQTEMDIDGEATIEWSHYIEREEETVTLPFFSHIK